MEYTKAEGGASFAAVVLHEGTRRGTAMCRRQRKEAGTIGRVTSGTFPQGLCDEAKSKGWTVISMKNDWPHPFIRSRAIHIELLFTEIFANMLKSCTASCRPPHCFTDVVPIYPGPRLRAARAGL